MPFQTLMVENIKTCCAIRKLAGTTVVNLRLRPAGDAAPAGWLGGRSRPAGSAAGSGRLARHFYQQTEERLGRCSGQRYFLAVSHFLEPFRRLGGKLPQARGTGGCGPGSGSRSSGSAAAAALSSASTASSLLSNQPTNPESGAGVRGPGTPSRT